MLTIRAIAVDIALDLIVAIDITTSRTAMTAHETTVTVTDSVLVLVNTSSVPLFLVVRHVAGVPVSQDTCVALCTAFIVEIWAESAVGASFLFLAFGTAVVGIGPVVQVGIVVAVLVCKRRHIIDLHTGYRVLVDKVRGTAGCVVRDRNYGGRCARYSLLRQGAGGCTALNGKNGHRTGARRGRLLDGALGKTAIGGQSRVIAGIRSRVDCGGRVDDWQETCFGGNGRCGSHGSGRIDRSCKGCDVHDSKSGSVISASHVNCRVSLAGRARQNSGSRISRDGRILAEYWRSSSFVSNDRCDRRKFGGGGIECADGCEGRG